MCVCIVGVSFFCNFATNRCIFRTSVDELAKKTVDNILLRQNVRQSKTFGRDVSCSECSLVGRISVWRFVFVKGPVILV